MTMLTSLWQLSWISLRQWQLLNNKKLHRKQQKIWLWRLRKLLWQPYSMQRLTGLTILLDMMSSDRDSSTNNWSKRLRIWKDRSKKELISRVIEHNITSSACHITCKKLLWNHQTMMISLTMTSFSILWQANIIGRLNQAIWCWSMTDPQRDGSIRSLRTHLNTERTLEWSYKHMLSKWRHTLTWSHRSERTLQSAQCESINF